MMSTTLTQGEINAILKATLSDPFTVLGMHETSCQGTHVIAVRAFFPHAAQAFVDDMETGSRTSMTRIHEEGIFEALFPQRRTRFPYQFEIQSDQNEPTRFADAYSFDPFLSDEDLTCFQQERHYGVYHLLGCHLMQIDGVPGALFAVWAPNARAVSVTGDFNEWDGRQYPMRLRQPAGVWELFIPAVSPGTRYEYHITTQDGANVRKTDPYGLHFEFRPGTASIVTDLDRFSWTDQEWMVQRKHTDPLKRPVSVYEVHLGSWKRRDSRTDPFLNYRELAAQVIPYVKMMGFTHIELLPVTEHPFDGSWGYQTTGYYAPTSRHGRPEDFMFFVNACHREGIGVIMDWVPSHFPKDEHSLAHFDGTCLYEYEDPRLGEHQDWGTLVFDYRKQEVRNFLMSSAVFWFEKFHIDGIRVDAVSSMLYRDYSRQEGEWVPNKYGGRENLEALTFLKEMNTLLHEQFPGTMTIAEESTSWLGVTYPTYLGGLEFTLKWNLGWMNDMLHYMSHNPADRKRVHTLVSFVLLYAFHERFMLELSHDEVVHGKGSLLKKMPGDEWQKFANLRLLFSFMFGHPGKHLLFMGDEFGQLSEWNHDHSLEWGLLHNAFHQGLQQFVRDLNRLYISEPALYEDDSSDQSFAWIDFHDYEHSIFSFMRRTRKDPQHTLICVYNFLSDPQEHYRIGVPAPGWYRERLNSDAESYGGSHVINPEDVYAEAIPWQDQPYSVRLNIPPLGAMMLKPTGGEERTPKVVERGEPVDEPQDKPVSPLQQMMNRKAQHKRVVLVRQPEETAPSPRRSQVSAGNAADDRLEGEGAPEQPGPETSQLSFAAPTGIKRADGPGVRFIEAQHENDTETIADLIRSIREAQQREAPERYPGEQPARGEKRSAQRYRDSQAARPQGSKAILTGETHAPKYQVSGS